MRKNISILFISFITAMSFISCDELFPVDPPKPENPASVKEISYGNHELQNMALHLPKGHTDATKVIVMVHGGGWVMGYKPDAEVTTFSGRFGWDILNPLLAEGYACAVIKYRTACYNTVPVNFSNNPTEDQDAMMEDIDLVIRHLKDSAASYEIGDDHFQLLGESGGSHIVLTYGIRAESDPAVKSVVSMFAPVVLDDIGWKSYLASLPLIFVQPPNYFRRSSSGCSSVTNQQTQIFSSLKSFANTSAIKHNVSNPELFPLSPHRLENINRNTATFIMQGATDELVPPFHADSMHAGLQTKYNEGACADSDFGCQLKKTIYPDCGHGWTGGACAKAQIMADIVSWMKQH
ncbi:MAG: alpha/beta hydrolase [Bacteroidia bacterium]